MSASIFGGKLGGKPAPRQRVVGNTDFASVTGVRLGKARGGKKK